MKTFIANIYQEIEIIFLIIMGYFKALPFQIYNDKALLFLTFIFTAMYLPHAFILNEDIGILVAYETDPGSIVIAIESFLSTYNMHASYHSKFYGWIYFVINFIFLKPVDLFLQLSSAENKFLLYMSIRLIFFTICLLSLIIFYQFCRRMFGPLLSFVGAFAYMFCEISTRLFYFIHPETTGIIFIVLAATCVLKFIEKPDNPRYYFYGIICLSLAVFSKQIFFFISLPFLFSYLYFYCFKNKVNLINFVISKPFWKLIGGSLGIGLTLLILIHPAAIYEFDVLLEAQRSLSVFVDSDYAMSFENSFLMWLKLLLSIPFTAFLVFSAPFALIASLYLCIRYKKEGAILFAINICSILLMLLLITINNRMYFREVYMQPILPFVIIFVLSIANYLSDKSVVKGKFKRALVSIFFVYFFILSFASDIHRQVPYALERFEYKKSLAYLTFNYLEEEISDEDRIAHGHKIAMPSHMRNQACHFWQGCGTDYIEEFNPNYVMYVPSWTINNVTPSETRRLDQYVKEHNMKLVTKINGVRGETAFIYKKP